VTTLRAIGRFAYDFVIGDDWRVAVGVALAIGVAAAVAAGHVAAWWVLPLAVATVLWLSVRREARATTRPPD
jgi:hypothetical protein